MVKRFKKRISSVLDENIVYGLQCQISQDKIQKFVVFEGLDGTGKSSIVQCLSKAINANQLHTPDSIYDCLRSKLHERPGCSAFFMYLSACAYALAEHETHNFPLSIVDRFWFSSIIEYCWKERIPVKKVARLAGIVKEFFPLPQLTIVLYCNRKERLERISQREKSQHRDRLELDHEKYWESAMHILQKKLGSDRCFSFDTTNKSLSDSTKILEKRIISSVNHDYFCCQ